MPIYEYQCQSCGHQLEEFQKISDAALTECPKCHQATLNKLISAAGFQLKGSGWYVTDYRDKDKAKQAEKGGSTDHETQTSTSNDKTKSSDASSTATTDTGDKKKNTSTPGSNDKSAASS
ncbi:MAG: hypothetical protein A3F11_01610 [Gammaproteobacteria bacterium RIFCSPHIGHO2_12_FULL_37_14]|nr:MAG: hypothetical protein A3F11_01610 [Gammaproteobacteria bacterium RIFCSPHIGHO2_12_FULL_37_14]